MPMHGEKSGLVVHAGNPRTQEVEAKVRNSRLSPVCIASFKPAWAT